MLETSSISGGKRIKDDQDRQNPTQKTSVPAAQVICMDASTIASPCATGNVCGDVVYNSEVFNT